MIILWHLCSSSAIKRVIKRKIGRRKSIICIFYIIDIPVITNLNEIRIIVILMRYTLYIRTFVCTYDRLILSIEFLRPLAINEL